MKFRKIAAAILSTAALSMTVSVANSADFPEKPVTLVVPWPAGGATDIVMRMLAQTATETLGQTVIVTNQPGAGGSIALSAVAKGDASGHTLSMVATGFITEQYSSPNSPVLDDFKVLAFVGTDPTAIAAGPDTDIRTLNDLIGKAKEAPGKLRNASPGGTSAVAMALIESQLGIKLTQVPYSGTAPVVQAVLSGETQTATPTVTDMIAQHKAGDLTILAVAGAERHFMAPDIPTFTEQGFPIVYGTMRALVVPASVDTEAAKILEDAFMAALNDEGFKKTAQDAGFSITPMGGEAATEFLHNLDKDLYPVLLDAGLVKVRQK